MVGVCYSHINIHIYIYIFACRVPFYSGVSVGVSWSSVSLYICITVYVQPQERKTQVQACALVVKEKLSDWFVFLEIIKPRIIFHTDFKVSRAITVF